jgi:phosphomannomutase
MSHANPTPAHPDSSAPLMLSVSGARGIVGASMTPEVVRRLAGLWGSHLATQDAKSPKVVLGRDSRPSGPELAMAAARGLADAGCEVISLGLVATPTVGVMISACRAQGGIMITASHNPTPWNGLKFLDGSGTAPPAEIAGAVMDAFRAGEIPTGPRADRTVQEETRGHDTHVAKVLGQIDPRPIQAGGFKVVLDSVNGAGGPGGLRLLEALGCDVVHINGVADGNFAHPPEPRAEHLGGLCQAVIETGADVGFAQDPDADRLAMVDAAGRYFGEEYTLALVAESVLERHPGTPTAANLSTSRLIDDVAARFGSRVIRTAVGEANVAKAMREAGCLIGGEGNGGVMLPSVTWVRDSLSGMALVLDLMQRRAQPLASIVDAMPAYAMVKQTIELGGDDARSQLLAGIEAVTRHYEAQSGAQVQTQDGVRVDLADGWVHLRASNTEPIARVIAESRNAGSAEEFAAQVRSIAKL